MDSPTTQEARDAVLRLDGHPLDLRIVDRFIDEHGPKMKDMTHDEQNDLADAIAKAPWNDPDYLPIHKEVVAALEEWIRLYKSAVSRDWMHVGREARLSLFGSLRTHPLPKPIEPPLHERVLALLGDGWSVLPAESGRYFAVYKEDDIIGYPELPNPNTPAQIADAFRVLAGEGGR